MTTYNVTFKRGNIYHANLAKANSKEAVEKYFTEHRSNDEVIAITEAASDDMKPGKPVITIE